jgi:hypothetical protein
VFQAGGLTETLSGAQIFVEITTVSEVGAQGLWRSLQGRAVVAQEEDEHNGQAA